MAEIIPLFPRSPCYVCSGPIKPQEGGIYLTYFIPYLKHSMKAMTDPASFLKTPDGRFIDAVTLAYFNQFPGMRFHRTEGSLGDFANDFLTDNCAHKHRLEKVIKQAPDQFAGLIVHDSCLDSRIGSTYSVELDRINTPEKALDWTMHLNEKTWFNAHGWIHILKDLFGRRPV